MFEALASSGGVTDPVTETVTQVFLSQGLMGVFCIILMYVIFHLRGELRDVREAHKKEIAAKDAQIEKQVEGRLQDLRVGFEAVREQRSSNEAILAAMRRGP